MLGQLTYGHSISCCCIEHEWRAKQQRHCFRCLLDSTNPPTATSLGDSRSILALAEAVRSSSTKLAGELVRKQVVPGIPLTQ